MTLCMSKSAEILRNLYKRSGFTSYQKLADAMGRKTASAIQRYFKDDARAKDWIDADVVEEFVEGFSNAPNPIPPEEVWQLAGPRPAQNVQEKGENIHQLNPPNRNISTVAKPIPIYGPAAAGATDRIYYTEQSIVGHEDRDDRPELRYAKDGYRMYVVGDSMFPRHEPGEMISVNPHQFPRADQDCVVILEPDGNAILKKFVEKTAKGWKFRQLNPPKFIEFKKDEVRAIHAVVR